MPVLLRQLPSRRSESIVGIYCFAFQRPSLLPLMTAHSVPVGEPHPLYSKSVGMGGPTLNSVFNSEVGPDWLRLGCLVWEWERNKIRVHESEGLLFWDFRENVFSTRATRRKCLSVPGWCGIGDARLWQHWGERWHWMGPKDKAVEAEQSAKENLYPLGCHLDCWIKPCLQHPLYVFLVKRHILFA